MHSSQSCSCIVLFQRFCFFCIKRCGVDEVRGYGGQQGQGEGQSGLYMARSPAPCPAWWAWTSSSCHTSTATNASSARNVRALVLAHHLKQRAHQTHHPLRGMGSKLPYESTTQMKSPPHENTNVAPKQCTSWNQYWYPNTYTGARVLGRLLSKSALAERCGVALVSQGIW